MKWEAPEMVEIRMDAEIGSYQEDFESDREPPVAGRDAPSNNALSGGAVERA
jgi:hypothetical protein